MQAGNTHLELLKGVLHVCPYVHTHSFACASVHYVHTDQQTNNLMYLEQVWETGNESWTTGMRMGLPGGLVWL